MRSQSLPIDVDFEVTSPSYNIRALRYSSVTLQCHITVDGQQADCNEILVFYWWKFGIEDKLLIWYTRADAVSDAEGIYFYNRKLIGSNYTRSLLESDGHFITFTKIRPEDTGIYYCSAGCDGDMYRGIPSARTPNITVNVVGKHHSRTSKLACCMRVKV